MSTELEVLERDTTVTPRKLRTIGFIPATIYGKDVEPVSVQVKAHPFHLALKAGVREFKLTGFNTKTVKVQQIQKHTTREEVLHIEFLVPSKN